MECDWKFATQITLTASSAAVLVLTRSNPYSMPLLAIGLVAAMWKCNRHIKEWVIAPLLVPIVFLYCWRFELSSN